MAAAVVSLSCRRSFGAPLTLAGLLLLGRVAVEAQGSGLSLSLRPSRRWLPAVALPRPSP